MKKHLCRVAVDAMGGDDAPEAIVRGAILAIESSNDDLRIVLVGKENNIKEVASDLSQYKDVISVVNADQVVEMKDSPMTALKEKKQSSIAITSHLLKENKVDAILSAGNTGAFMAASLIAAGKIEGVVRPAIGTFYPRLQKEGFLLDIGANMDCKPHHLFQFGLMGATFLHVFKGIERPRVGLLNVGQEELKGDAVTVEAHQIFKESKLNFVGNVEGKDILGDKVDVVVCDGFVGNVLVKLFGTMGQMIESMLVKNGGSNNAEIANSLHSIKEAYNYENHGGVPLLGINGISIVSHGHSSPEAIKTAIFNARSMYVKDLQVRIKETIGNYRSQFD